MTKKIKNPAAVMLGKMGGRKKSEAKARAARENNRINLRRIAQRYLKECPQLYEYQRDIIEAIRKGEKIFILNGRKFGLATLAAALQPEQKTGPQVESENQLRFDRLPDSQSSDMSCSSK